MGFGLTNALATFCTVMNKVLAPFLNRFIVVYLDDIVIYGNTPDEHMGRLWKAFQTLSTTNFMLKIEKCSFAQEEVPLLSHIIGNGKLCMNLTKIKVILEWEPPTKIIELRSTFSLVDYYQMFMKGYSTIADPCTDLLKKGRGWT